MTDNIEEISAHEFRLKFRAGPEVSTVFLPPKVSEQTATFHRA